MPAPIGGLCWYPDLILKQDLWVTCTPLNQRPGLPPLVNAGLTVASIGSVLRLGAWPSGSCSFSVPGAAAIVLREAGRVVPTTGLRLRLGSPWTSVADLLAWDGPEGQSGNSGDGLTAASNTASGNNNDGADSDPAVPHRPACIPRRFFHEGNERCGSASEPRSESSSSCVHASASCLRALGWRGEEVVISLRTDRPRSGQRPPIHPRGGSRR